MAHETAMMDENKQAVLLLSAYFSRPKKGDPSPLTALEYGRFALWLKENLFQPQDLFHRFDELSQAWQDPKGKITAERLKFLLGRGMAMGIALEKWQSAGIWVLSRSDSEYPRRLKTLLGVGAPAILFGVGNKRLLNAGGLAIVGSRNIDDDDRKFASNVAGQAANEGLNVISGGARGVDEVAMLAALEVDGTVLGVLSNDLFKAALANKWRRYIKSNQLLLISPFYPDAGFQVGNAMGRNKYVYCLADFALVVRSEDGKGGTWSGAQESLKKGWVPLFVKDGSDCSGNPILLQQGARPLVASDEVPQPGSEWLVEQLREPREQERPAKDEEGSPNVAQESDDVDIQFRQFLDDVRRLIDEYGEAKLAKLTEVRHDLRKKQITDWLDRAADEGLLERKGRLRSYTLKSDENEQLDIFS